MARRVAISDDAGVTAAGRFVYARGVATDGSMNGLQVRHNARHWLWKDQENHLVNHLRPFYDRVCHLV